MPLQVLVVDDEELVRRVIVQQLGRLGASVFAAASVDEGRAFLEKQSVDAIFLDIWLGPVSGFELYTWIQEHRPDLADKVAFVSGDIVGDVAHRRLKALGRPLVAKPFDSATLKATLSDLAPNASS